MFCDRDSFELVLSVIGYEPKELITELNGGPGLGPELVLILEFVLICGNVVEGNVAPLEVEVECA